MHRIGRVLFAGILIALAGCGGKRLYPVEGVVQYEDGSPAKELAGGTVSLESVVDKSNAAGEIGKDGTFRIRDPLGKDGASAGEYRVLVQPSEGNERRNPPIIDPIYARYESSGLTLTVKEEPNRVTVVIRRPGTGKKG
jgi:hypothetical protein